MRGERLEHLEKIEILHKREEWLTEENRKLKENNLEQNKQETVKKAQKEDTEELRKQIKAKDKEIKNLKAEVVQYKDKYEKEFGEGSDLKRMNTPTCNSLDQIKQLNEDLICQNEELKKENKRRKSKWEEEIKNRKEERMGKFDKRGKCEKGINCRYKHRERSMTEWCRFDKEGRCIKGEDCKYNTNNNKKKRMV